MTSDPDKPVLDTVLASGGDRAEARQNAAPGARRQARADGTASRARLLTAAGRLFARQGFDGVSTRELAKAARVNLSAIAYHFGGKEGLYREVLHRLVVDSEPMIGAVIAGLGRGVADAAGDKAKLAAVTAGFVRHMLGGILGDERMRWQMAMMLKEFQEPSKFFTMLLDERVHPLHNALAELVAAATGRRPEDPETRLLTVSLIGQIMAFGAARTVVWARLGWDRYTPERVETIVRTVTPVVLGGLGLPLPAAEDSDGSIPR